jgi:hypothetical protein
VKTKKVAKNSNSRQIRHLEQLPGNAPEQQAEVEALGAGGE